MGDAIKATVEKGRKIRKVMIAHLTRTSRNQKVSGLSGKLQITNPKLQTNHNPKITNYK